MILDITYEVRVIVDVAKAPDLEKALAETAKQFATSVDVEEIDAVEIEEDE